MDSLIHIASAICLTVGCFFMVSGGLGLLRFPDFYTRSHAAGMTDTLATPLIIAGLILLAGWSLVTAKLLMILLFAFLTSPTSGHALGKSAQHGGLKPVLSNDVASHAGSDRDGKA